METEKKKVQDALIQIDTLNDTVEATNIHKDAIAEKLKAIALERDILEEERHNWEIDQANHSKLQEEFVELKSRKSAEIDLLKLQLEEMTVANSDISTENSRLWKEVQKLMTELECVKEASEKDARIDPDPSDGDLIVSQSKEHDRITVQEEHHQPFVDSYKQKILDQDSELKKCYAEIDGLERNLVGLRKEVYNII